MYGDTNAIRRLATGLREQAVDIRAEGCALRGCVDSTVWSGVAADALRLLAEGRLRDLEAAARRHDEAATALDRHAAEVDRLTELIAAIERRVDRLVDGARERIGPLADRLAASPVGRLLGGLADPVDELLDRFVPPPSGHREWLEVDLPGLGS